MKDINKYNALIKSKVWIPKDKKYWRRNGSMRPDPRIKESEIKIIQSEILKFPNCRMLQIGTAYGCMAFSVLPQLCKISGNLITLDIRRSRKDHPYNIAGDHFENMLNQHGLHNIIEYNRGGSDIFFASNNKKFDLIFVDGHHVYDQVKRDTKNSIETLNSRGVIFMHDAFKKPGSGPNQVFNEVDKGIFNKERFKTRFCLVALRHIGKL